MGVITEKCCKCHGQIDKVILYKEMKMRRQKGIPGKSILHYLGWSANCNIQLYTIRGLDDIHGWKISQINKSHLTSQLSEAELQRLNIEIGKKPRLTNENGELNENWQEQLFSKAIKPEDEIWYYKMDSPDGPLKGIAIKRGPFVLNCFPL